MIRVVCRGIPNRHDGIADELIDRAIVRHDHLGERREIARSVEHELLGIGVLRDIGEARDVREQDRHLPAGAAEAQGIVPLSTSCWTRRFGTKLEKVCTTARMVDTERPRSSISRMMERTCLSPWNSKPLDLVGLHCKSLHGAGQQRADPPDDGQRGENEREREQEQPAPPRLDLAEKNSSSGANDSQAQVRRTGCLNRAERRDVGPAVLGFKELLRVTALPPRRQRTEQYRRPRADRAAADRCSRLRRPGIQELGHARMGDRSARCRRRGRPHPTGRACCARRKASVSASRMSPATIAAPSSRERRPHSVPDQVGDLEQVRVGDRAGAGLEGAAIPGPLARIVVRLALRPGRMLRGRGEKVRDPDPRDGPPETCRSRSTGRPQSRAPELRPNGRPGPVNGVELDEGAVVVADVEVVELPVLAKERCQNCVEGLVVRDRPGLHGRELLQHLQGAQNTP